MVGADWCPVANQPRSRPIERVLDYKNLGRHHCPLSTERDVLVSKSLTIVQGDVTVVVKIVRP
jgi:hypothetical protein